MIDKLRRLAWCGVAWPVLFVAGTPSSTATNESLRFAANAANGESYAPKRTGAARPGVELPLARLFSLANRWPSEETPPTA